MESLDAVRSWPGGPSAEELEVKAGGIACMNG